HGIERPGSRVWRTRHVTVRRAEWWAHKGSNLGPLPCEGNALPLSYAPGQWPRSNFNRDQLAAVSRKPRQHDQRVGGGGQAAAGAGAGACWAAGGAALAGAACFGGAFGFFGLG